MSETAPLLHARVAKHFGPVIALKPVDFSISRGEVRALLGSNGAGKSTLLKILTGAYKPSRGQVLIEGKQVETGNPRAMLQQGIGCIYQHSGLVPNLSICDNIFLGRQPTGRFGALDQKKLRAQCEALLETFGIELDLSADISALPTVKQKEVEILKALALDARLLLMDEPTAWLSHAEVDRLHQTIRSLKSRGVSIVYVSHVLDEVFAICDTASIMRDGEMVWNGYVRDLSRPELVRMMVGERLGEMAARDTTARKAGGNGKIALKVRDLTSTGVFENISLDVHQGEIFCLTGLIGARRTELIEAIFGAAPITSGSIELEDRVMQLASPRAAIRNGIGLVPEDRHVQGLLLQHTVWENLPLATLEKITRFGLVDFRKWRKLVDRQLDGLAISPRRPAAVVGRLSGGNQQKVMLGKWLEARPRLLILDEPTVGVDIGAKAEIYAKLRELREAGTAILVVSSDLEEVMAISDRIGVMVSGRLVSVTDAASANRSTIIAEMGGEAA